ncbi:unnamed protein product [Parajaminaea phylloscopi]
MGRHTKNNSAFPNFTAAEYAKVRDRWGSKKARLGGESLRRFDQCALCLSTVRDPQICKQGHLFCKECIYTSILEQKSGIAAYKVALAKLAAQQDEERAQARVRARQKVLQDFERGIGFGHVPSAAVASASRDHDTAAAAAQDASRGPGAVAQASAGAKRKASADRQSPETSSNGRGAPVEPSDRDRDHDGDGDGDRSSTLASLPARAHAWASAAEERAMAELEEEQRASRKSKLPSFWLPSLTPSEREGDVDLRRVSEGMDVRCRVADEHGHALSLKSLKPIKFTTSPTGAKACPTCAKDLSNNTRLHALRSCCGSVVCDRCHSELIQSRRVPTGGKSKSSGASPTDCPICGVEIKDPAKDIIGLQREGTGYAGGGGLSEVKAKGTTFQG